MHRKNFKSNFFGALLFVLSMACFAEEIFSLDPYAACKFSPQPPPKSILEKKYQTHMPMGRWHILDINGDGLCDWVRNGREGFRYDIDAVPLSDMIYLGTPSGWRNFETRPRNSKIKAMAADFDEEHLHGFAEAHGFYQPISVYRKGHTKPYIIVVERMDAPAPPPNIDAIDVLEWDDNFDSFRIVRGNIRLEVLEFLRSRFCNRPDIPQYDGETLLISLGALCDRKRR